MSTRNYATYDIRAADVPRDLFPRGRVKFSLGVPRSARKSGEDQRRRDEMERLRHLHAWDVLKAIQDGRMHVADVSRRVRRYGEAALPEMRRELDDTSAGRRPTFNEEVERYLAWYGANREVQSTNIRRSRLSVLAKQTRDDGVALGDVPIDKIVRADLEGVLAAVGGMANTRESYRVAISGLFTWSINEERERARADQRSPRWDVNPATLVESRAREVRVGTASDEQVLRLLASAEPYQAAYVRAFVHLGLRLAELQHTRLALDLDLTRWLWTIQPRRPDRQCRCSQCGNSGWSPKNVRGVRTFRVPAEPRALRDSIEAYMETNPARPGDFVFRNPRTGGAWIARTLADDFKTLCERAEVPYGRDTESGLTLHTLRHTCATNLVRAGVRESVIAGLLGDTVQTVVETYVNLDHDDLAVGISRGPAFNLR